MRTTTVLRPLTADPCLSLTRLDALFPSRERLTDFVSSAIINFKRKSLKVEERDTIR